MTTARDIMTPNPVSVPAEATLTEAARLMRDEDIGDVLVTHDGQLRGIITDRDIVVRAIADGIDPATSAVEECYSSELLVVEADDQLGDVVAVVRDRAIRRLPVTEDGRLVGVISLGDLARHKDPESALADISAAPANS